MESTDLDGREAVTEIWGGGDEPLEVDRPGLGEFGRLAYLSGGFLLLLATLISSDDFFLQWGLGFLGPMALTLGYSFFAARQTLRRRRERKRGEEAEDSDRPALAAERSETNRDYAYDLLTGGILAFLANWMYPTATILIEVGKVLEGWALVAGSGVFGATCLLSLSEGVSRFREYRKAERELKAGSLVEHLVAPPLEAHGELESDRGDRAR
ncbi:hypothetical protein ACFL0I_00210 [Gemmatimonadota bacterium]